MRLLYILDKSPLSPDADVEQAVNTAAALGLAGAEVELTFPWAKDQAPLMPGDLIKRYGLDSVPTLSPVLITAQSPLVQQFIFDVKQIARLRCKNYDLVYTRKTEIAALALLCGARVALDQYKPLGYHPWLVQRLLKWVLGHSNFTTLFLHSSFAQSAFLDADIPSDRLMTAYNGSNRPAADETYDRDLLDLPQGIIATYSGRVRMGKGLDLLRDLALQFPEVTFVFIGADGLDKELEDELAAQTNVLLLPWMASSKVYGYLKCSDILLLPPTADPLMKARNTVLPLKTYSYLSAGKAILGAKTADVSEILHHGENACLVEPGDMAAAIDAFNSLITAPKKRQSLGEGALLTAQELTWTARGVRIFKELKKHL